MVVSVIWCRWRWAKVGAVVHLCGRRVKGGSHSFARVQWTRSPTRPADRINANPVAFAVLPPRGSHFLTLGLVRSLIAAGMHFLTSPRWWLMQMRSAPKHSLLHRQALQTQMRGRPIAVASKWLAITSLRAVAESSGSELGSGWSDANLRRTIAIS
jgi:hypothetical protein